MPKTNNLQHAPIWEFTKKEKGEFISIDARKNLKAYFPLFNFAGLMSCVTPELKGDIKTGQNTFLTPPLVTEDILHSLYSRNLWIKTKHAVWSATGCGWNTSDEEEKGTEKTHINAGILYYKLSRENKKLKLLMDATIFVPLNHDTVEISLFQITNTSKNKAIDFKPYL